MLSRTAFRVGVISLALVGTGTLLVLNGGTLFENLVQAWDTQAEKTEATLFRWGELMSIGAELKARYGSEPDVTYDTSTSARTLNIRFSNDRLPEQVTTDRYAREIAAFAVGKTKKFKQIDAVKVQFGVEAYTFALGDLMSRQASSGS